MHTYDPSLPSGQVRLLINDVDPDNPVFEDDEIDAFLALEGGDVHRAAAEALDTIATNEALTLKVLKTMDLQTDGAKLAEALMARAEKLRATSDTDAEDAFAVAEFADPVFALRERRWRQLLRETL